jgi:hypothetical protein
MSLRITTQAGIVMALLIWAEACSSSASKSASSNNAVRPIPVTRTISLHAQQLRDPAQAADKTALTLSSAAADEPAEGPTGFDVMPDGGFLVTDPLRRRLVSYDAQGNFRWDLPVQYAAETVRLLNDGDLETVDLADSKSYLHVRDARGNFGAPQAEPAGQLSAGQVDAGVARLINAAHGSISDPPGSAQAGSPIEVFFEAPARHMVSLRRLGKDAQGNSYVAVESASGSDTIDIQTNIRKYAPNGREIAEVQGILADAIVHPVEEFRERGGLLYQMVPYASEVRILVWDTNGVR